MKLVVVMLVCAGIFLGTSPPTRGQQTAAVVRQVSYVTAADGKERIEVSLSDAQVPQIFMIDGDKPRLVLDFPESGYAGKPSIPVARATLVRSIRVGLHTAPKRKTRVVVDLAPGSKVSWSKELITDKHLLVVSLTAAAQGAAKTVVPAPVPAATPVPESAPAPAVTPVAVPSPAPVPPSPPALLSATVTKIKAPSPPASEEPDTTGKEGSPSPSTAAPAAESADKAAVGKKSGAPAGKQATNPVLLNVSFDNAFSQSGEMVLIKLNDFKPPKISTQEKDPPRIFCDFAGAVIGKNVGGVLHAGGKFIKDIRISRTEKGARVALELVAGYDYDLQQVFFKEDNLFVLIINSRKPAKEAAEQSP